MVNTEEDADVLSGLNAMMSQMDTPAAVADSKKQARKDKAEQAPKPATAPTVAVATPVSTTPVADATPPAPPATVAHDPVLPQQILDKLDGIKASIDTLAVSSSKLKPAAVAEKRISIAEIIALFLQRSKDVDKAATTPDTATLFTAAFIIIAFAMGMGYGALVASSKFPYWASKSGVVTALASWIAAPAGILLLPVLAVLFLVIAKEIADPRVRVLLRIFAGLLGLSTLILPFMV